MSNLHPKTALDAHLVVAAVGQQGHQDTEAPKVYNLLAELVANSQTGQRAAELTQDAGVVRECCREGERGTVEFRRGQRTSHSSEPVVLVRILFHPLPGRVAAYTRRASVNTRSSLDLQQPLLVAGEDTRYLMPPTSCSPHLLTMP